jgi:excisionase family DNA binding protein
MQLSFEQLPFAISELTQKINNIERLLLNGPMGPPETDQLLTIEQAAEFLNVSVQTIYRKVSQSDIPSCKQGKRLYFSKADLLAWVKSTRKTTMAEVQAITETNLKLKKRK